jgi:hypothetical protein
MKKLLPWFLGMLIGVILSVVFGVILLAAGAFVASDSLLDNGYDTLAVSWSAPRGNPRPMIYQARVTADPNSNGTRTVRAAVYIGSGLYSHDLGVIGSATSHEEAIRRFGEITWTDTELRIGGTDGVQATLALATLEQHR